MCVVVVDRFRAAQGLPINLGPNLFMFIRFSGRNVQKIGWGPM